MNIVDQMGRHLSLSLVLFVFHCCSAPPGGESDGSEEMADGVDHIDIYADVEEEFNQVINPHSVYFDNYAHCSAFAYCFAAIVTTEEDRSLLVKQAHLPYRPRFTMLQLQPQSTQTTRGVVDTWNVACYMYYSVCSYGSIYYFQCWKLYLSLFSA